jgi:hypothetical protein
MKLKMKNFKQTANNSIISIPAIRWPLFHKGRSWPKPIYRGGIKLFRSALITILFLTSLSIVPGIAEENSGEPKYSEDKRFIDNADGTISDTKTGLMWMKDDSYQHKKHWLNWFEMQEYVEEINNEAFANYTNWKVPTTKELSSLYEAHKVNSSQAGTEMKIHIDPIFSKNGSGSHWSAETNGYYNAFGIVYNTGNRFNSSRKNKSRKAVRAVRQDFN